MPLTWSTRAKDFKADIYSFGVVCWNVLTGGIRDSGGDWSAPCYAFSAHNFANLANNHRLLEKHAARRNLESKKLPCFFKPRLRTRTTHESSKCREFV